VLNIFVLFVAFIVWPFYQQHCMSCFSVKSVRCGSLTHKQQVVEQLKLLWTLPKFGVTVVPLPVSGLSGQSHRSQKKGHRTPNVLNSNSSARQLGSSSDLIFCQCLICLSTGWAAAYHVGTRGWSFFSWLIDALFTDWSLAANECVVLGIFSDLLKILLQWCPKLCIFVI